MERRRIPSDIGFADGTIESYRKVGDTVEVYIKTWTENRLRVSFRSVVRMLDSDGGDLMDLCEIIGQTEMFQAAVARVYDVVPSVVPYRHFQFVGVDGDGVLDVVAEAIEVCVLGPEADEVN